MIEAPVPHSDLFTALGVARYNYQRSLSAALSVDSHFVNSYSYSDTARRAYFDKDPLFCGSLDSTRSELLQFWARDISVRRDAGPN